MDKRINCNDCPLFHVEVDTLCETYCSDMADYREELRADTIEECIYILYDTEHSRSTESAEYISKVATRVEQLKEQK